MELLEKANIKVPHFVSPKLLSFIVNVHDEKPNDENEKNTSNSAPTHQTPQKDCEKSGTNGVIQKIPPTKLGPCGKEKSDSLSKPDEKLQYPTKSQNQAQPQPKSQLDTLPELNEVQSFGSVDLIPVTSSSKPDPKVHEKPVKNFVEITPLPSNQPNESALSKPETSCELAQPKESSNVQGRVGSYFCRFKLDFKLSLT